MGRYNKDARTVKHGRQKQGQGTELTGNSEHVTCVKRHVSVAVGARAAALRVPVLPQGHRQQVRRRQGHPQVVIVKVQQGPSPGMSAVFYLVLLHLTVEGKSVDHRIIGGLVTTGGQHPNTINDAQWKMNLSFT